MTPSNFDDVKKFISSIEGGYADNSTDLGGETKYGISKREYPNLDIQSLTFDRACVILERDYWVKYRISEIGNQAIANRIFLAYINMNPNEAGAIVQRVINVLGGTLIIDGVMGTTTINAINSVDSNRFIDKFRIELTRFYAKKVQLDKTQLDNLVGWVLRRALL